MNSSTSQSCRSVIDFVEKLAVHVICIVCTIFVTIFTEMSQSPTMDGARYGPHMGPHSRKHCKYIYNRSEQLKLPIGKPKETVLSRWLKQQKLWFKAMIHFSLEG